jgi:GT2 family glycosyltransferase
MSTPPESISRSSTTPDPAVEVSFVIASRNGWAYLAPCLASLGIDGAHETLVIDNASTDGTPEAIRRNYPAVRLQVNMKNEGHCHAINQGICLARGKYVVVLDADTVLESGAVSGLVEFLRGTPQAVIAAPRMLNPDGSAQETARSFPKMINGLFGRQSVLTKLFPKSRFVRQYLRRDAAEAEDPFEVDWVSAACLIFHRSLPERIGLWDEGFQGYWVDADWCKTAHAAGKVYCVPSSRVVHFEQNRSGRKKGAARIKMFHAGVFRFYRKHHTLGYLDPRAWLAGALLGARCALLLAADWMRPADRAEAKPELRLRLEEERHD